MHEENQRKEKEKKITADDGRRVLKRQLFDAFYEAVAPFLNCSQVGRFRNDCNAETLPIQRELKIFLNNEL